MDRTASGDLSQHVNSSREVESTYCSSAELSLAAGEGGTAADGFLACPTGTLAVVPGAALVAVEGRVVVVVEVLVEGASDVRGAARVVGVSAAGRVVRGRFAAVAVEGAMEVLEAGFPGDAREAAAPGTNGVLRTVGFRVSSPEVTDERSGSASDVVLDDKVVLRGPVPAAGRVGGLFRLDPAVLVRDVALDGGFVALAEARVLAVAGRVALVAGTPGRRGGADLAPVTGSLPEAAALEAILRRRDSVGIDGAGSFLRCGLPACGVLEGASVVLAEVGASILKERADSGVASAACYAIDVQQILWYGCRLPTNYVLW
jgi:hypothetical protein